MADLDDDAIVVTLPAEGDGTTITKIEGAETTAVIKAEDDPIEDLKGQFAQMTHRATSSESAHQQTARQLEDANRELQTVRSTVTDSQLDTVLSGIQAAEAEATSAEQAFITAAEAGDFAAQARAQRKISAAETRLQRLTEAKGDLEDQKATKPAPGMEARPEPRQEPTDKVETFAKSMSPRSAAWIRSHPDCVTDAKKNARMLAAHNLAVADDIAVDSDEYFKRIEAGVEQKSPVTKVDPVPVKDGKRPTSAAAPSGHAGGGMNGGATEVRLTQREVTAATDGSLVWNRDDPNGKFKKDTPIGVQEFARRKMIMKREGLYDKSVTE